MDLFLKINNKKMCHKQNIKYFLFFKSARWVCSGLCFNSITKNCTQIAFFFKKRYFFAFLNPKIVKIKKTLPKHRLTLVN